MALMSWFCPICGKYISIDFWVEDDEIKKKLKAAHDEITPGCKNRFWD